MKRTDHETFSAVFARREAMLEPNEVTAMLRLNKLGWGSRRIAREFGCSRTTVQVYIDAGGWQGYRSGRLGVSKRDRHEEWLRGSAISLSPDSPRSSSPGSPANISARR